MEPGTCCYVSFALHCALPVRHDERLFGVLVLLELSLAKTSCELVLTAYVCETRQICLMERDNNSGDNSTIDGLGTTGFELAPAAS